MYECGVVLYLKCQIICEFDLFINDQLIFRQNERMKTNQNRGWCIKLSGIMMKYKSDFS